MKAATIVAISLAAIVPASAQNGANAYLLSLSPTPRAAMLGKAVGEGCVGADTFYMGVGTSALSKDQGFWSVRCQSGQAYVVEAHPDGKTTVIECAVLKATHAGECFKKLPGTTH